MERRPIRILYIDDDQAGSRLAQKRLVRAGYEVDIANDGETGLRMYQQGRYDLVAVDHQLPVYNGLEVIRQLTTLDHPPPIIMVTGSGDEQTAVEAMKMGASDYVTKDMDGGYLDLLPVVIEQALRQQALRAERQSAIEALIRRNQNLALLQRASQTVTATLDLNQVIEQLLRVVVELVQADGGSVWLWSSEKEGRLDCLSILRQSNIQEPASAGLAFSEELIGWVAKQGRPLLVNDVQNDARFPSQSDLSVGAPITNVIAVPIQFREVTKGALMVSNKKEGNFDENDLFLTQTLASNAAIAIENARLFTDVQRLSIIDDLTGLYSRRHFLTLADHEFQRAIRSGHDFVALMIDIDHFKQINDKYGHLAGDKVLKMLAEGLRTSLRSMDIIGRYGGEEFVILLPETNLSTAKHIADRMRTHIENSSYETEQGTITITISVGLAAYSSNSKDLESMLTHADKALYISKAAGRNRVSSD